MATRPSRTFTTQDRRNLFLEMARVPGGTTTSAVYQRAISEGDTVTAEAYHMLARRLAHRGLLSKTETPQGAVLTAAPSADGHWLEEDELASIVDADYPILALSVWKEANRLASDVPEPVWVELRERLRAQDARELFACAIESYCDELHAQIGYVAEMKGASAKELPRLRHDAEASLRLLEQLTKHGLELSREAVRLPLAVDQGVAELAQHPNGYVDRDLLRKELVRRVSAGPFVVEVPEDETHRNLVVVAVDGSTRGGMLSFEAEGGDFSIGHAPMVSINTSVGQVNRQIDLGQRRIPVFLRLPEKPEDMQRQDNRYTVMAKLLHPDMSDAQYMHAVWNAMDLIETRAVLRSLQRWYHPTGNIEIPAADVVLRDGPVAPQDRDFNHYCSVSSYGQIARDAITASWDVAKRCRDDDQVIGGVVKNAQLSVFAPILNWFACETARNGGTQIASWPLRGMNVVPDQAILTRLLTAGRSKGDPWLRTAIVSRPFSAVTNYAKTYTRARAPWQIIAERHQRAIAGGDDLGEVDTQFWDAIFRPTADPYVQMLRNVAYGSFFLGAVPRLDTGKSLPRMEFLVVAPSDDEGESSWDRALRDAARVIQSVRQEGFDVSAEHSMFESKSKLDVLPKMIINAHETVKLWAAELLSRFREYIGYQLASYVNTKKLRGLRVRPFTRAEIELLYSQLKSTRDKQAGSGPLPETAPRASLADGEEEG